MDNFRQKNFVRSRHVDPNRVTVKVLVFLLLLLPFYSATTIAKEGKIQVSDSFPVHLTYDKAGEKKRAPKVELDSSPWDPAQCYRVDSIVEGSGSVFPHTLCFNFDLPDCGLVVDDNAAYRFEVYECSPQRLRFKLTRPDGYTSSVDLELRADSTLRGNWTDSLGQRGTNKGELIGRLSSNALLGEWCSPRFPGLCFKVVRTGPNEFEAITTSIPSRQFAGYSFSMKTFIEFTYAGNGKGSGRVHSGTTAAQGGDFDYTVDAEVLLTRSHNTGITYTWVRRVAGEADLLWQGHWRGRFKWMDGAWEEIPACLLQDGSVVNGRYTWGLADDRGQGTLRGHINGDRLDYAYTSRDCADEGHFVISENGSKLTGTYSCGDGTGLWNMERLDRLPCEWAAIEPVESEDAAEAVLTALRFLKRGAAGWEPAGQDGVRYGEPFLVEAEFDKAPGNIPVIDLDWERIEARRSVTLIPVPGSDRLFRSHSLVMTEAGEVVVYIEG